jgi:hypothetical protein
MRLASPEIVTNPDAAVSMHVVGKTSNAAARHVSRPNRATCHRNWLMPWTNPGSLGSLAPPALAPFFLSVDQKID